MSDIIKFPGASRRAGTALIAATLDRISAPLSVAGQCRDELREVLQHVNDVALHCGCLRAARFNHGLMLSRAALVSATHAALVPIAHPHICATPVVTAEIALRMLTVLFSGVGKAKNVETATLLRSCVAMFDPRSDIVGEATGLWSAVSSHPVILALSVNALQYNSVFTSTAELRTAMQEARRSIVNLINAADRWMELLRASDRVMFEFDRAAWMQAYANVGADVVDLMQDPEEAGDEDENEPPSPRWSALEELRLAKLIE